MLDNYIFFEICDKSIAIFNESYYSQYRSFCYSVRNNILLDDFSSGERARYYEMIGYVMLIFGFDVEESMMMVKRYFLEEWFVHYEFPVKMIRDTFRMCLN